MKRKPRFGTATYLHRVMLSWLSDAGCYHCSRCDLWKKKKRTGYCASCQAQYERDKYVPAPKKPIARNWEARMDEYLAKIADPTYYQGLRITHMSPLARLSA